MLSDNGEGNIPHTHSIILHLPSTSMMAHDNKVNYHRLYMPMSNTQTASLQQKHIFPFFETSDSKFGTHPNTQFYMQRQW